MAQSRCLGSVWGHVAVLALLMGLLAPTLAIDIKRLQGQRSYTKRSASYGSGYGSYGGSYGGYGGYGGHQAAAYRDYQDHGGWGYRNQQQPKKSTDCPAYEPFRCPGDSNKCISIQYLCDGAPDCPDAYDEDLKLCTAAKRPPVEETKSFLSSLIASHGPNYLEKLFGVKARNALKQMGGVQTVAVALSESPTIEMFGREVRLGKSDVEHLRTVFMAIENGDIGMLKSLGIKDSELGDVRFFLEKLVLTGFLD